MISCLLAMVLLSTFVKAVRNHKIMGAFAIQNSMKIFNYQESSLNTLNGVRSLMMLWVVFSHEYAFTLSGAENAASYVGIVSKWQFLMVFSGYFAVDTFFFIGGFLVAYAFLKEQSTSFFKYPLAILNRYLRLIPAYFMAIMLFYKVYPHLNSGPYWYQLQPGLTACDNNLWKTLLFINNLTNNMGEICLGWGWYLQNDMQLFVYSVFLLAIYSYNKMAGYMSIVWSMLASFAYSMVMTYTHTVHNTNNPSDAAHNSGSTFSYLYSSPWSRAPPYLFGLLLGILYANFLFQEKKEGGQHIFI